MQDAVKLVEIWRGPVLEGIHRGHAVICDAKGEIRASWGNPDLVFLPRSASKMLQALPLIESGAAADLKLTPEFLALACASHNGAAIHTDRVQNWLRAIGKVDDDFRCGSHEPKDIEARNGLIKTDQSPCQMHNNCSGKHTGFLSVARHLGAGPEYIDPAHPVQLAVREAFEDMTGLESPGFGIDGCSAPNFATTLRGMARAMAKMADCETGSQTRNMAAARLVAAMAKHPELVAGEGRSCTELMRAMGGKASIKTGAEAVFVAILPGPGLGVAVKIEDGGTRAAEAVIASLLVQLGVLEAEHPTAKKYMYGPITNCRDTVTGHLKVLI
ncbi:MAG: asparaginase [Alphaproteobacteria bacterium]|nr:asparaginase [Alphaproteobacteria bacterium]